KLGPYIDTFLASKVLAELDGTMTDDAANARIRRNLQKCVAKIEKAQLKDGSWNLGGGWAPILGTSIASQSLYIANTKGPANAQVARDRVERYTAVTAAAPVAASAAGSGGGSVSLGSMTQSVEVSAVSAGVPLYKKAQELEQLSRTDKDRQKNAKQIREITDQL